MRVGRSGWVDMIQEVGGDPSDLFLSVESEEWTSGSNGMCPGADPNGLNGLTLRLEWGGIPGWVRACLCTAG